MIKLMREKSKDENVEYDYCEIETKNVELENSVAKLLSENKRHCNEINHVKQVFKEQFDSIKKTHVHTKEHSDSLIDKLNLKSAANEDLKAQIQDKVFVITLLKNDLRKIKGKEIIDIAAQIPSASTIVSGMFKLDLEPLAHRLLQNREAHLEYLKYTQEQGDIFQGIVEQSKAKQPLDKELDFALQKRLLSHPKILSRQLGLKCSTSKCGSKPTGNKRNDRILQTTSRNIKNKVEAQPRKVNKKDHVVESICDVDVKHLLLNANSKPICANCCPDWSLVSGLQMFKTHDREPLSTHELSCALGKSKKSSHQPKAEDTNQEKLYLLHMDLCGPMCVASINGKRYILVIVDDYSRFTLVRFLRTKDEAPEAIIKCIKNIQVHLNATVRNVRTDNGTGFVNQTLREFYENVGITHQTSVARTP
ncbi:retrovirus-related pol polyprotein from transposon TNT 1-94 [Tanacetum coccineum]